MRRAGHHGLLLGVVVALAVVGSIAAPRREAVQAGAASGVIQAPALPGAQPISGRDRVYTADQTSNTITVINPATNDVLGTLDLGNERLDNLFSARYYREANVHGLGFSPDGSLLDAISITTNSAILVQTATNTAKDAVYVGRAPHEGFVTPDGRELWVAVRGQNWVSVIDLQQNQEVARIPTAAGPAMVVFSPDGQRAFVNHDRAPELLVIDVPSKQVLKRITGLDAGFSPNLEVTPDGKEVWLTHKNTGRVSVVDARALALLTVLDTGPVTNHVNFVAKHEGIYAYVTVGGLNKTLVFRTNGAHPEKVAEVSNAGYEPHGIWPSPDNTRVYVGLEKSDAVDVIDTDQQQVIATVRIGQEPQALVYVANAVPDGDGRQNLKQQGLGKRIVTRDEAVPGTEGTVRVTVREVDTLDMIQVAARGLSPTAHFSVYLSDGTVVQAVRQFTSTAQGTGDALAFTTFFGQFDRVVVLPEGTRPDPGLLHSVPVLEQPAAPQPTPPATPVIEQPHAPQLTPPATPVIEKPEAPQLTPPATPAIEQPAGTATGQGDGTVPQDHHPTVPDRGHPDQPVVEEAPAEE